MKSTRKSHALCSLLALLILLPLVRNELMAQSTIITAAERLEEYLPMIEGKKIGLVVNQTSMVGNSHLVDTLASKGMIVKRIFAPEHGFRGDKDAGEKVRNTRDQRTGAPVVSLYGKNYKPTKRQVGDLDYLIFDIQDVGTRCYTFISTLHYIMEASAENDVPLIVLDRPNPNGHYVDGPVLDTAFSSFVGIHPIPLVYGLTIGELAQMINGEGWLSNGLKCELTVISLSNYEHSSSYQLPQKPSPNLPDAQSIAMYPSLVFFEGTNISVGRGTLTPFQMIGHPNPIYGDFEFKPRSLKGMAKNPPYENETCYGVDLRNTPSPNEVDLSYLISFYKQSKNPNYFNNFFTLLAGTDELRKLIESGKTVEEIRSSWQPELEDFKLLRSKYLLYPE